jgi:glycosyltransferase involved in cell wall biosynthesis
MHDVQELHFPEYFTPEERAERATLYLKYIKYADKIIVSYEHIKADIIKYFHKPANDIQVCLLDMNNLWFDKYNSNDVIPFSDTAISGRYIIYPANTWQHKNHMGLLNAVAILKQKGISDLKIICTGHKTPYFYDVLQPFIEQHNLNDNFIFPGILSEEELYSLYVTCVGVIVPTMYEAGSFPLMESILLGVPVICSNVTSLPETIGNSEFIFDPTDAHDISRKLLLLWQDHFFIKNSIANNVKQASRLQNTGALNKIISTYQDINN